MAWVDGVGDGAARTGGVAGESEVARISGPVTQVTGVVDVSAGVNGDGRG
ncbi:hypothetical protein [Streptomyces sp. NRRL B-1140]|nr:hypothetical protein [Streptomyces sp. NRRL B-1140]